MTAVSSGIEAATLGENFGSVFTQNFKSKSNIISLGFGAAAGAAGGLAGARSHEAVQ